MRKKHVLFRRILHHMSSLNATAKLLRNDLLVECVGHLLLLDREFVEYTLAIVYRKLYYVAD